MNPFANPLGPLDGFSGYGVPGDPMEDVLSLQSLSADGDAVAGLESPSGQCNGSNSCSGSTVCTNSNICTGSNSCVSSNSCA